MKKTSNFFHKIFSDGMSASLGNAVEHVTSSR